MSKQQLRGHRLKAHLRECLMSLAAEAKNNGKQYKYNASELKRVSGISRVTLNKYEEFIDSVLEEIGASDRIKHGQAGVQHLLEKIERLEGENTKLVQELSVVRTQHIRIYEALYYQSIDACTLIEAIIGDTNPPTSLAEFRSRKDPSK